ncbi:MAG: rhodanese-like domain-containing protein [Acidimicrobiia bacterium]|nr:rhodanese-like domain-containing protein [Acidimicrobiia bacterium]
MSEISVHDVNKLGVLARVVDVREPDEWAGGHIGHAEHIPLAELPDRVDRLDGATIYLVCHSGGRSGRACEYAAGLGYDVVNVTGGMTAWSAAGYDVVTGG